MALCPHMVAVVTDRAGKAWVLDAACKLVWSRTLAAERIVFQPCCELTAQPPCNEITPHRHPASTLLHALLRNCTSGWY